nr:MAG TPA: BAH domain protein [Caudoviricetes sp.]
MHTFKGNTKPFIQIFCGCGKSLRSYRNRQTS